MLRRLLLLLSVVVAAKANAATYFVELRPESRAQFRRTMATNVVHDYSFAFSGVVMELSSKAAAELRKAPGVVAVHEDHRILPFEDAAPVTSAVAAQAIIDARARVNASALPARGQGITVAVLDSGIGEHPALDIAGGYDFANDDPIPEDIHGHGTHVAGIIAANGADIVGVAPDVTLLIYKIIHVDGEGKESSLVAALDRAIDPNGDGDPSDHVDVVNISAGWNSGPDSIGSLAVDRATAAGIVVVVAAGNEYHSPAQVKAPGVAPTAITVANARTETEVMTPSSRGPVPGTLAFKPDLAAPGEGIVSTRRGGGTLTMNGTSQAAPHVAGIAALLLELHPNWTPADVKRALVSTTRPMNGPSLARGTGYVDAQAAHEARFFLDVPGLSFGVNGAKAGTFDATRTFSITNRSQTAATFNASAQNTPEHAQVTITPSSFSLAAGATREVSVRVVTDNANLVFTNDGLAGGTIRLQSPARTVNVPWGLVRAARATIAYDGVMTMLSGASKTIAKEPYRYGPGSAEVYTGKPGELWDFVMVSDDARVHVVERTIENDEHIELRAADANRVFTLDARDASGTPLRDLPDHRALLRMTIDDSGLSSDLFSIGNVGEIRMAPYSSRVHFAPVQLQLEPSRAYVAMHPELNGDGGVLTETEFRHARLRWPVSYDRRMAAIVAYDVGSTAVSTVEPHSVGPLESVTDVYLTTRTSLGAFAAVGFSYSAETIGMLRATDDGIVSGNGRTLSPVAHRIANGAFVDLGRGPVYPFGTAAHLGTLNQTRDHRQRWSLFNAQGALVNSGIGNAPAFEPNYRYVATSDVLRGELAIAFGASPADLIAPTLTSMRVLDAQGALAERVDVGEAGVLRFSAADLDFSNDFSTKPTRPEKTRTFYRAHGASAWNPLQVVIEGADNGTPFSLGHVPAGDIYRVDLSAATAASAFIDLRIDIEDAAGNQSTWTQSSVFVVGDVVPPLRRRAVR